MQIFPRAVTNEVPHSSSVSVNASASNNNLHSVVLHRQGNDRRPNVSAVVVSYIPLAQAAFLKYYKLNFINY